MSDPFATAKLKAPDMDWLAVTLREGSRGFSSALADGRHVAVVHTSRRGLKHYGDTQYYAQDPRPTDWRARWLVRPPGITPFSNVTDPIWWVREIPVCYIYDNNEKHYTVTGEGIFSHEKWSWYLTARPSAPPPFPGLVRAAGDRWPPARFEILDGDLEETYGAILLEHASRPVLVYVYDTTLGCYDATVSRVLQRDLYRESWTVRGTFHQLNPLELLYFEAQG